LAFGGGAEIWGHICHSSSVFSTGCEKLLCLLLCFRWALKCRQAEGRMSFAFMRRENKHFALVSVKLRQFPTSSDNSRAVSAL